MHNRLTAALIPGGCLQALCVGFFFNDFNDQRRRPVYINKQSLTGRSMKSVNISGSNQVVDVEQRLCLESDHQTAIMMRYRRDKRDSDQENI